MTAKEMFEKLGYVLMTEEVQSKAKSLYQIRDLSRYMCYSNNPKYWDYDGVIFDLKLKSFCVETRYDGGDFVDVELYKAITQQMKELGWIENETNIY